MANRRPDRNRKVSRVKTRQSFWNIGTVMAFLLLFYLIVYFVIYAMSPKIKTYEVTSGPLSGNYRYTALTLKSETIFYSNEAGNIRYFARENSKVGVGQGIYSVGKLKIGSNTDSEEIEVDEEDYAKLRTIASNFSGNYESVSFQEAYNFKADSQTAMLEIVSKQAMDEAEEGSTADLNLVKAEQDGYVLYSMDGMEELTPQNVTSKDFVRTNYSRTSLRMNDSVKAKDPVYKLITSEEWSLMIPLDIASVRAFTDKSTMRFSFLEDGSTFNGDFEVIENNGEYFGKIDISNSVVRFAADRYVDIELILEKEQGLKIPNTAILERMTYKIPKEYATSKSDKTITLIQETFDTDGSAVTKIEKALVYDETDTDYYVDTSLFHEGDYVLMKDSQTAKYQISEKKKMIGVFCINKGYAEFKTIEILDSNEEYTIIKPDAVHGIVQYDHIALNASVVTDDSIVVRGVN